MKDLPFFLAIHLGLVAVSISLAEWPLILSYSALGYVVLRLVDHVSNVLPFFIRSFSFILCGFGSQSGLSSLLLPYPGVNPLASIVTLVCSFPADSDGYLCGCV